MSRGTQETPDYPSRRLALEVLRRIDEDGAFAAPALSSALDRAAISGPERALATELVYGVLRVQPALLRFLGEQVQKLPQGDLLRVLELGVYQLLFLDRLPAHIAVSATVELASSLPGGQAKRGFVNAILRKVAALPAEQRPARADFYRQSVPAWLRKRLERSLGEEAARAAWEPGESSPPLTLCLREGASWGAELEGVVEPVPGCPQAFRYTGGGDPRRFAAYQQGAFTVQELGAQILARAAGIRAGDRVLDVCAGRGQKTFILAEAAGPSGEVWATDLHEHKLSSLQQEALRFGAYEHTLPRLARIHTQAHDFCTPPPPEWEGRFDWVFVDAPCSGTGTLRRRPEILRRLSPSDPERLAALQLQIVEQAARTLRPGGRLVFSTCSLLPEEGEALLPRLHQLLKASVFGPNPVETYVPPESSWVQLSPLGSGTDGYFVTIVQRS